MGSEIISIIFAQKIITPIDTSEILYSSAYNAGKKIITGKVGIAKENAGRLYIISLDIFFILFPSN